MAPKRKIISCAIRKHKRSLTHAHDVYRYCLAMANASVSGIIATNMPDTAECRRECTAFVASYETADTTLRVWCSNVMPELLQLPANLQMCTGAITRLLEDAEDKCDVLVTDPRNEAVWASLDQDWDGLSSQFNLATTFVSGALMSGNCYAVLPDTATALIKAAQLAARETGADSDQISTLNAQVRHFQSAMDALATPVIARGIQEGGYLTTGLVASAQAFPTGTVALLENNRGAEPATAWIALDGNNLSVDLASIGETEAGMNGTAATVASLSVLAASYARMTSRIGQIHNALQGLLAVCRGFEGEMASALSDMRVVAEHRRSSGFAALEADLHEAISEWSPVPGSPALLTNDLQVNTASLRIGMSSPAVHAALADGRTLPVLEYYNQLAGSTAA